VIIYADPAPGLTCEFHEDAGGLYKVDRCALVIGAKIGVDTYGEKPISR
jgi:hypothetical protein